MELLNVNTALDRNCHNNFECYMDEDALISDYAILLGGWYSLKDGQRYSKYVTGDKILDISKINGVKMLDKNDSALIDYDDMNLYGLERTMIGVRLVIDGKSYDEGICGYFPMSAVSEEMQIVLEKDFNNYYNLLYTTEAKYPTGNMDYTDVYGYKGKKYVRVISKACTTTFTLSNGCVYHNGDFVWVEVEEVKLKRLVDGNLVTEKVIMAGMDSDWDLYKIGKAVFANGEYVRLLHEEEEKIGRKLILRKIESK